MMTKYLSTLTVFLILSGLAHLIAPVQTERWMSRVPAVRVVGVVLLLFAIPPLFRRGWFFWSLFVALAISGLWRLCFPRHCIRAQQRSYPRWIHGCLLLAGAFLVWTFRS